MDRKKNGNKVKKPVRTPHLAPQSILRLLFKIRQDKRKQRERCQTKQLAFIMEFNEQ